jgi:hypothetical protein
VCAVAPFDCPDAIESSIRYWKPSLILLLESELCGQTSSGLTSEIGVSGSFVILVHLAPSNNHSHIFWCPNHLFKFRACMSRSYCFCFKLVSASFNGKCLLWTWLVCQFSDFGGSFKCTYVIEVFHPLVNASRVVISLFDALGANTCHPLSNSGGLIPIFMYNF